MDDKCSGVYPMMEKSRARAEQMSADAEMATKRESLASDDGVEKAIIAKDVSLREGGRGRRDDMKREKRHRVYIQVGESVGFEAKTRINIKFNKYAGLRVFTVGSSLSVAFCSKHAIFNTIASLSVKLINIKISLKEVL